MAEWCLQAQANQMHPSTPPLTQQIKQNVEVVQTTEATVIYDLIKKIHVAHIKEKAGNDFFCNECYEEMYVPELFPKNR